MKFRKISGRGCWFCKGKPDALADEYPDRKEGYSYLCPVCCSLWFFSERPAMEKLMASLDRAGFRRARRSDWKLFEVESDTKCTRCGKVVSLCGAFGSWGESEPQGLLINGAPYCWDCMERTAEIIEASAR